MKFLIHSNAPTQPTGYGVQTRYLADFLTRSGFEVAVSCTYGHQGQVGKWVTPAGHDVRLYPSGYITSSGDVLYAHAQHWFDGNPENGVIIVLSDVWSLAEKRWGLQDWNVLAWAPVDHFPTPPGVLDFFHLTNATPIAMAEFGREMFVQAGLSPGYAPLAVDTSVYKPTFTIDTPAGPVSARALFNIPDDAFVVGMVAMNKDPYDRKGFNEALRSFGQFWRAHQHAVLFIHTDPFGVAGGLNLNKLAAHAAVPEHALIFPDPYAYRLGLPSNMMAAAYTAMDVLLAPSRGEGFCVPLIEAQACGTPVIASDFSAQSELINNGWRVAGQLEWDPAQEASYFRAYIPSVIDKLEAAYAADLEAMQDDCIEFAKGYDVDKVMAEHWQPLIDALTGPAAEPKPPMERVDVIVPLMRPENLDRLMMSVERSADVNVIVVHDGLTEAVAGYPVTSVDTRQEHTSYAEKVNLGFDAGNADFVLLVGDDCEFTDGWFNEALTVSTAGDVIGTNDSEPGRTRNELVAAGRHADHFFLRRSYVDELGSSLDGPGVVAPTAYNHWYVDREIIELAKARGVYVHANECRIIHHHPGYDGDEQAREDDPTYMRAVQFSEEDQRTWMRRAPLIEGHRVARSAVAA